MTARVKPASWPPEKLQGLAARLSGLPRGANPYAGPRQRADRAAWDEGWNLIDEDGRGLTDAVEDMDGCFRAIERLAREAFGQAALPPQWQAIVRAARAGEAIAARVRETAAARAGGRR